MANPIIYAPGVDGLPLSGSQYNNNWALSEQTILDLGPLIISGLVPSIGAGLSVSISPGVAVIGAEITLPGTTVVGPLEDNNTVHLYLTQQGQFLHNITGTPPVHSVKLGTALTTGGAVASLNLGRLSGRQQFCPVAGIINGGIASGLTSAGMPRGVDLSKWAAVDTEGFEVFGILPAGAATRAATILLCSAFTPAGTGADIGEVPVPYDAANGTTSITWSVRRITLRVNVAGGSPSVKVQKSSAGNATFGAGTDVGTVTFSGGDFVGSVTSSLGTVASGDLLRFNVLALGSATGWTISVQLGNP